MNNIEEEKIATDPVLDTQVDAVDNGNESKEETEIKIENAPVPEDTVLGMPVSKIDSELDAMNYIELESLLRKTYKNLDSLTAAIEDLKYMQKTEMELKEKLHTPETEAVYYSKLENPNSKDAEKLNLEFIAKRANLLQIKDKIESRINEKYDAKILKQSSFITGQLIESMQHKIDAINRTDSVNKPLYIAKFNAVIAALRDRTCLDVIKSKASVDFVVRNVKNEYKKLIARNKNIKETIKNFGGAVNQDQFNFIRAYLIKNIEHDEKAINLFLYHLSKMVKYETKSGLYMRSKIILMNITDIIGNTYDLEGGKEKIDSQLIDICSYYKKAV
jgi:hypothetical protein